MKSGISEGIVIYPDKMKTPYWSNYTNAFQEFTAADIKKTENVKSLGPKMLLRLVKDTSQFILENKDIHDF